MPIVLDGSGSITGLSAGGLPDNSVTSAEIASGAVTVSKIDTTVSQLFGMRNRIINGDMRIAQRATTASNVGSSAYATLDRFVLDTRINASPTGSYTQAQSTDAPTGFNYSFSVTVTTAGNSLNSAYALNFQHFIEGYNIADLAWGTANAQTITLSFWVKSSITGSYGFGLINASYDAAYVGQYTVISANTWEKKTVTIPGPTIGTWDKTTGRGIQLKFSLGTGSGAVTATPNTWIVGEFLDASSSTASPTFWSTAGAVWKITGVQLEIGLTATPFERRQFGQELALCQRYFEKGFAIDTAPTDGSGDYFNGGALGVFAFAANALRTLPITYRVEKRASPTVTLYRPGTIVTANTWAYYTGGAWAVMTTGSIETGGSATNTFNVRSGATATSGSSFIINGAWSASSEL
jgi:hypothetical protein